VTEKQKPRRLNREEFLKVYDSLWQEGPPVKYQKPDNWVKPADRS
jgi:hypothetical protein